MLEILLKGKPKVKCNVCHGEGFVYQNNALRTCRNCEGKGYVETVTLAERALARFNQPKIYRVSYEHNTVLVYQYHDVWELCDRVLMALRILKICNVKAEIVFQI